MHAEPLIETDVVMARVGGENFPVASRLLPRAYRRHLLAIYGFARLVDELGDELAGDRLAALASLEAELEAAFAGKARHPLLVELQPTIVACSLPQQPFLDLIEANRQDQHRKRYETWTELEGYCRLSANPVGALVLGVFGCASRERLALSDRICTALQLVEHCQDVAEDMRNGRVYLPAEDLREHHCTEQDLSAEHAGPAVRAVVEFELARAQRLIEEGAPLLATLHGRPRLAVAAFLAGGRAAIGAVRAAGCDVLERAPKASTLQRVRELLVTLARASSLGERARHARRAETEAT